ncbi:hypothetical protein RclHR1_01250014 [Rhizophagus clarus]|uniref:F-box domain-containing protein n=1 Tax=Rhizophagus clarus TaxID=94130 RepID=A0A2Z6QMQ3_9GLOM|nr:hypothetical protein RclHR1_01250014 [Rhizophagus clarus]GES79238.1 hypothetical protein GLOIN_2v1784886 [Rhizophagus clarus]
MTCSKLFSGDLPELINKIIQHFHHDYKTLHSCILVNRLWCRLAIPLLWKNPFSHKSPKNHHCIEICLHNLNDDDKIKLNEYVMHKNLFYLNTLFSYPSFIQCLETHKIINSINKWIETIETSTIEAPHFNYILQNTNSSFSQSSKFKKLIYKSLFQIFIENEVNLKSFEVSLCCSNDLEYFDETLGLILQNPNFICNIKNFKIDLDIITTDNVSKFLNFLYSNCNSISSLYLLFTPYDDSDFLMIEKELSQIISTQENLKMVLFGYNEFPLHHLLLSLKNPNCLNTLETIIFYYIDFENITVLNEVFNQLNVLKSIHIVYCHSLDSQFVQQIINIPKPFKLKSLILNKILSIESLEKLIQKSGNYLENFGCENAPVQLFESAIKYCNKIKLLHLTAGLNNQNINLVFSLIENIKQNLNYLFLKTNNIEISSIILQNLGNVLPNKLEYLYLYLDIDINDFEIFLKDSQDTFIKKLLIRNEKKKDNEKIFHYIEEYIMKKKRVKYLGISRIFDKDLFFLKDKVEEFKLHDIQVLSYNDLYIDIYDFIISDD